MQIYKTSDKQLASFLCASGLVFKKIEKQGTTRRCDFILEIPDEINFSEVQREWFSDKMNYVRKILRAERRMTEELYRFFNSQEKDG